MALDDSEENFMEKLSSLYETRPPVSRAKMAAVTKSAIKAIKFYKHVVQSVEKFVMKCKPEYKIPGLYVIDSIVRQSRHQFGDVKEVFGPRFTKNIVTTFQCLLKCPPDERSRVIRVLNLWQKNNVFPMEIIQPLLDMVSDPNETNNVLAGTLHTAFLITLCYLSLPIEDNIKLVSTAQLAVEKVVLTCQRTVHKPAAEMTEDPLLAHQSDIISTVTKLLQQTGEGGNLLASGQDAQLQQLQLLQQQLVMHTEMMSCKPKQPEPVIDNNLLAQIKLLTDQLLSRSDGPAPQMPTHHQKAVSPGPPVPSAPVAPPTIPRQPVSVSVADRVGDKMMDGHITENKKPLEPMFDSKLLEFDYGDTDEEEESRDDNRFQHLKTSFGVAESNTVPHDHSTQRHVQNMPEFQPAVLHQGGPDARTVRMQQLEQQQKQFDKEIVQESQAYHNENIEEQRRPHEMNLEPDVILLEEEDRAVDVDHSRRRPHRSRERSRSPKRRRHSRSQSRERRRSREGYRSRDVDRERQERERQRERERERKKLGLPPIKVKHVTVCSTTLFIGHLTKHTSEGELTKELAPFGPIGDVKMVPPRGCAFVCMDQRRNAAKAVDRLKGFRINNNAIRVAWAPNIGVKESQFFDLWDVELGATYIPWSKLPNDLSPLLAGGMLDEDTLPDHLRDKLAIGGRNSICAQDTLENKPRQMEPNAGADFQPPASLQCSSVSAPCSDVELPSYVMPPTMIPLHANVQTGQAPIPPRMVHLSPAFAQFPPAGPAQMPPAPSPLTPMLPNLSHPPQTPPLLRGHPSMITNRTMGLISLPHNILPPQSSASLPPPPPSCLTLPQVGPIRTAMQMMAPPAMPASYSGCMDGRLPGLSVAPPLLPPPGLCSRLRFQPMPPMTHPPPHPVFPGVAIQPVCNEGEQDVWRNNDQREKKAPFEAGGDIDNRITPSDRPPSSGMPQIGTKINTYRPGTPLLPMQCAAGAQRPSMMDVGNAVYSSAVLMAMPPGFMHPRFMPPPRLMSGPDIRTPPQFPRGLNSIGYRLDTANHHPRSLAAASVPGGNRPGMPLSTIRGTTPYHRPVVTTFKQWPNFPQTGSELSQDCLSRQQELMTESPPSRADTPLKDEIPCLPVSSGACHTPRSSQDVESGACSRSLLPAMDTNVVSNSAFSFGVSEVKSSIPDTTPCTVSAPCTTEGTTDFNEKSCYSSPEYGSDNSPAYGIGEGLNDVGAQIGEEMSAASDGGFRAHGTKKHGFSETKNFRSNPASRWNSVETMKLTLGTDGKSSIDNGHLSTIIGLNRNAV